MGVHGGSHADPSILIHVYIHTQYHAYVCVCLHACTHEQVTGRSYTLAPSECEHTCTCMTLSHHGHAETSIYAHVYIHTHHHAYVCVCLHACTHEQVTRQSYTFAPSVCDHIHTHVYLC